MSKTLQRDPVLVELERLGLSQKELNERLARELGRRELAEKYLADPIAWHKYVVIPPDKLAWREALAPMHVEAGDFIQNKKFRFKIILWPREALKSEFFTVGESMRRVMLDPDTRVLLEHRTHIKSKQYLAGIRAHLNSDHFKDVYGNVLPIGQDSYRPNNAESLTITKRKNLTLRDPNWSTGGLDKTQTSGHFDIIIADDLVTRENRGTTPEQLEGPIQRISEYMDLMDKRFGELWVIGTRWHPMDVYGWILENHIDSQCRPEDDQWQSFQHVDGCRCMFDVNYHEIYENGSYCFPYRFNDEVAAQLLRMKGPEEYACQYMNNPVSAINVELQRQDIEAMQCSTWNIQELRKSGELYFVQVCDPAESKRKKSAYTALVTIGVHKKSGQWFAVSADQLRVDTKEFIELVFRRHKQYDPVTWAMEANTRKQFRFVLEERMMAENYFFTIDDVMPKTTEGPGEKERRFKRAVAPLVTYGRLKVDSSLRDLIVALSTAPKCRYWDLLDCLYYATELIPAFGDGKPIDLGTETAPTSTPYEEALVYGWPEIGY